MLFSEILGPGGRVFAKSEWGPISDGWPAISFTFEKVANDLSNQFQPKDILISVGSSTSGTKNPEHRRKILSAVKIIRGRSSMKTESIVPHENWLDAQKEYPDRWKYGLPVEQLWIFNPFPEAKALIPDSYSKFGNERGKFIILQDDEIANLLNCTIEPRPIQHSKSVRGAIAERKLISAPKELQHEFDRIAGNILRRVSMSGKTVQRTAPVRLSPKEVELKIILSALWEKQQGRCALCNSDIQARSIHPLLQMSPDRIDSSNENYDASNMQITHLGCNFAKNEYSKEDFMDWLRIAAKNLTNN